MTFPAMVQLGAGLVQIAVGGVFGCLVVAVVFLRRGLGVFAASCQGAQASNIDIKRMDKRRT